jgi:dTMP kinase
MTQRGLFIVLEGGEGVGKTTQVALLSEWMRQAEIPHVAAREPGGTPVGEAIREVVLGRPELDVPAESELMLILAARAAFVRDVVRPALAQGKVVLADRFALSTLAYQGHGRGLDLDAVRSGIDFATGGLTPELYVVLDLPASKGADRQKRAGASPDRIEQAGDTFLERVRRGYLELAMEEPGVAVLSAEGAPEEVHRRIRALLAERFPETFGPAPV